MYVLWSCVSVDEYEGLIIIQVRLGKNGVEEVLDLGPLSDFEKEGLEALKPELKSSIEKGVKFANQWLNRVYSVIFPIFQLELPPPPSSGCINKKSMFVPPLVKP